MSYFFFSMSNRQTRKNIGVCIVKAKHQNLATARVLELNLQPALANDIETFELNEEQFQAQGLELEKFYTREEILAKQFETFQAPRAK